MPGQRPGAENQSQQDRPCGWENWRRLAIRLSWRATVCVVASRGASREPNMRTLDMSTASPRVGLAYGPGVMDFIGSMPGLVDYLEVPFEQLRHSPDVASIQETMPVVLHCASM